MGFGSIGPNSLPSPFSVDASRFALFHPIECAGTRFHGSVVLRQSTFERGAYFSKARLNGEANFNAVWGKCAFSFSGAVFEGAPDFEEAPRLDNVEVKGRLTGCSAHRSRPRP